MSQSNNGSATHSPDENGYVSPSFGKEFGDAAYKVFHALASLRLTVFLFVLSLGLVFFGTLAQMNEGIWTVVDKYFRSAVVWVPVDLLRRFFEIFFDKIYHMNPDSHWNGSFPFPGGWLLGSVMLVNLLAAHILRFKMTWKRSGIFVIHAGVILLMISELVTGLFAVESTMTLVPGETCNFVDETLTPELVVTRPLDASTNEVVKVPASKLKHKGLIQHNELPVDIEVLDYWKNSKLDEIRGPAPDDWWIPLDNGNYVGVSERPEGAGVESEQRGDAPCVRVQLKKKGSDEVIGRFMLSVWYYPNSNVNPRALFLPPFQFQVDGKDYTIELRNRRVYKPYSIHLYKVEHAKYEGTSTPKDFASTVEVIDPEEGNREARIWMNNPLRYREESYYQLTVLLGNSGTVLQVVRNPGRLLPYISCSMVALGLLIHFGLNLSTFLRRRAAGSGALEDQHTDYGYVRYLPLVVVGLTALWVASKAIPPSTKDDKIDYYDAGQIPVLHNGRVKPLDTVARTTLQAISSRTEVTNEDKKFVATAMEWYLAAFDSRQMWSGKAAEYKVFRIDNDQVLSLLKLRPRPEFFRYSLEEIQPNYAVFQAELQKIQDKGDKKLNLRDTKLVELYKKLQLYSRVARGLVDSDERRKGETPNLIPPQKEGEEWLKIKEVDDRVEFTEDEMDAAFDRARDVVISVLKEQGRNINTLPPAELKKAEQIVRVMHQQMLNETLADHRDRVSPAAAAFTQLAHESTVGEVKPFKETLTSYRDKYLKRISSGDMFDIKIESFFNHFAPFLLCGYLYIMVIILGLLSWLIWQQPLNRSAFWLGVFALILHSLAIFARIYLQGRPPVTNLYSSAVFIGWGCMLVGLILEGYFRNGVGSVVGGTLGALTMLIAHKLSEGGDTMEMLQAVLDTDFWLATHVTTVTLGYMATFVAGFISLLYVIRGIFTKEIDAAANKAFGQMIYGVICGAVFLSFTGTILGGLWADYSWGRFWGWDAKENGAVMVVIWNTLILHARWAGLVKLRGVAVLSMVGIMITMWSWFGTNQLGAGLHAYGFSSELAERCMWVWVFTCAPIALGASLPLRYWRSFSPETLEERAELARLAQRQQKERAKDETGRA